jgi:hypothetical protein
VRRYSIPLDPSAGVIVAIVVPIVVVVGGVAIGIIIYVRRKRALAAAAAAAPYGGSLVAGAPSASVNPIAPLATSPQPLMMPMQPTMTFIPAPQQAGLGVQPPIYIMSNGPMPGQHPQVAYVTTQPGPTFMPATATQYPQ